MAVAGQVFAGDTHNLADQSHIDIRPASPSEATVHNICYSGPIELYLVGSVSVLFSSDDSPGNWSMQSIPVTNTNYLRIKNVAGRSIDVAYNGRYLWPIVEE